MRTKIPKFGPFFSSITVRKCQKRRFFHFLFISGVFLNKKIQKTLFHELTHMKQWIEYRLTWDGQKSYFCQESVEDYDYWDQPHEVEARNEEQRLYDLYLSDKEGVPVGKPSYDWSNRLTRCPIIWR